MLSLTTADTIEMAASHGEFGKRIQVRLYVSGKDQELPKKYPFARAGRPDWESTCLCMGVLLISSPGIVRELKDNFPHERSIPVHSCGPAHMQEEISAACNKLSSCSQVFDYHPETFSF